MNQKPSKKRFKTLEKERFKTLETIDIIQPGAGRLPGVTHFTSISDNSGLELSAVFAKLEIRRDLFSSNDSIPPLPDGRGGGWEGGEGGEVVQIYFPLPPIPPSSPNITVNFRDTSCLSTSLFYRSSLFIIFGGGRENISVHPPRPLTDSQWVRSMYWYISPSPSKYERTFSWHKFPLSASLFYQSSFFVSLGIYFYIRIYFFNHGKKYTLLIIWSTTLTWKYWRRSCRYYYYFFYYWQIWTVKPIFKLLKAFLAN